MNRIEFLKSIEYPDFPNMMDKYFEQSMLLYEVFKNITQDIIIFTEEINPDSIVYDVHADEDILTQAEDVIKLAGVTNIYKTKCELDCIGKDNKSIHVKVERTS